jgi:hypothetical protein
MHYSNARTCALMECDMATCAAGTRPKCIRVGGVSRATTSCVDPVGGISATVVVVVLCAAAGVSTLVGLVFQ